MKVPTNPLNESFQSYQYFSQIRKFISVQITEMSLDIH